MTPAQLQAYLRWINSQSAPGALGDAFLGGAPVTQIGNTSDIGSINVLDIGAKGDGVTDDTVAFNTAISLASASGAKYNTVRVPRTAGTGYLIKSTLVINSAINIIGDGWVEDTSNTPGNPLVGSALLWGGGAAEMIKIISVTSGHILVNGSIIGLNLDGATIATRGIWARSTNWWTFSVRVQNVITAGVTLDDGNGVLSAFNDVRDINFVYGSAVAVQPANGLELTATTWGCTQNVVTHIGGLLYNGTMVQITGGDNNHLIHVHSSVQAGGTGAAISFLNGGPDGGSNNNIVDYVNGPIIGGTLNRANRILALNSEASSVTDNVTATSGNGIDFTVVDRGSGFGGTFDTPHRKMWKRYWAPAALCFPSSSTAASINSTYNAGWSCAHAATQGVGISIPPQLDWGTGNVTYILLAFQMDTANVSKSVRLQIQITHGIDGNTPSAAGASSQNFTVAVHDAQWGLNLVGLKLSTPMPLSLSPECVLLEISRLGADAADTATGGMIITGVGVVFQGLGPQTVGDGTYTTPDFVVPAGTTPVPSLPT